MHVVSQLPLQRARFQLSINYLLSINEILRSICFVDTTTGFIVGNNGIILKTSNGGNSWDVQQSGTHQTLYSVHFPSNTNGYVGGIIDTLLSDEQCNSGIAYIYFGLPVKSIGM